MASDFNMERLPRASIVPRILHDWSVHHSIVNNNWIATISRTDANDPAKLRYHQFSFTTEREARKFCVSYAPPKLVRGNECRVCHVIKQSLCHCRNCGVTICERCSSRWSTKMLPKTYHSPNGSTFGSGMTRVCKSCDWISNAFCLALLQGRYQDAIEIHSTGNVNLRSSFADIHHEAMFPIHCAVMGGSFDLVKWLVEVHLCPLAISRDPRTNRPRSVQTSAHRTLMDLVMTGRPRVDILTYLVKKGLSVEDVKDRTLIPKTLDMILKNGAVVASQTDCMDIEEIDVVSSCATDSTNGALEDACKLCCERTMSDCVLQPCGHQICCVECGNMLQLCPVCKQKCSVMRIYRQ